MNNDNLLNAIQIVSFIVGVLNYNENLTQTDKDDIMQKLDQQTKDILQNVEKQLQEQNDLLKRILQKLGD
jgi:enamine deaminase RidA (YjgF/YER057c/UK114 family)